MNMYKNNKPMDSALDTLKKQEPTTLSAQAARAINYSRKFSNGALVLVIGLACLGLGALTPTKADTEKHDDQQEMEHPDDKTLVQKIEQQVQSVATSIWAPYRQDIVEGFKIILMKMVSNFISTCYTDALLPQTAAKTDLLAGLIWTIAARWDEDNKKEKLSYKDLSQTELFMVLLPKLATTSLCWLLGEMKALAKSINKLLYVTDIVISVFIYSSRPEKKFT